MSISEELKYYEILSEKFPTKKDAIAEIINLKAILSLPKGTEHFISDIHGEYEHFRHIIETASGVIRAKIEDIFGSQMTETEKTSLANLIYYPKKILKIAPKTDEWYEQNLLRLIEVCRLSCGKYTRSKVRKALPEKYAYIIDELLNCDSKNINKNQYYNKIIESIISLECADDFVAEIAGVIRRMSIDHLHIVGDIFDRGQRPDIVMDIINESRSVDIQWGNHDVVWMGAMMGSEVCVAIAVANSLKYANTLFLEEGYGVSLRRLEEYALENYRGKSNLEKMYKAISVIRYKLEDNVMKNNLDFGMTDKTKLDKVDFDNHTWCGYKINCEDFDMVDKNEPSKLSDEETEIITGLKNSFLHSEKMQRHLKFLFAKGSIYLCYNGNLLYHGCIPVDERGVLQEVKIGGRILRGRALMDYCEKRLRNAYKTKDKSDLDFAWYMWCSPDSPLFGKKKMATFERMYIEDEETHIEEKQPYFMLQHREDVCDGIFEEFGLDKKRGHIINGHMPVKLRAGENPIKANGKLLIIDGGMSKSYRAETGIAGYTLTYNSYGLALTSHYPFESVDYILENNLEMMSQKFVVEKNIKRILVKDTDTGIKLLEDIEDLKKLVFLYNSGVIPEKVKK